MLSETSVLGLIQWKGLPGGGGFTDFKKCGALFQPPWLAGEENFQF